MNIGARTIAVETTEGQSGVVTAEAGSRLQRRYQTPFVDSTGQADFFSDCLGYPLTDYAQVWNTPHDKLDVYPMVRRQLPHAIHRLIHVPAAYRTYNQTGLFWAAEVTQEETNQAVHYDPLFQTSRPKTAAEVNAPGVALSPTSRTGVQKFSVRFEPRRYNVESDGVFSFFYQPADTTFLPFPYVADFLPGTYATVLGGEVIPAHIRPEPPIDQPWSRRRFVTRRVSPAFKVVQLQGTMVRAAADPNRPGEVMRILPNEGFPDVQPQQEVEYTWFQVPIDAYPQAAIAELGGRVNAERFDIFPPETMRLDSAKVSEYGSYWGPPALTVTYVFTYLPNHGPGYNAAVFDLEGITKEWGHNHRKVPVAVFRAGQNRKEFRFRRMTLDGTLDGEPVYKAGDFYRLFRPDPSLS